MDERLRKRIRWFYFAGTINLVLGIYVVVYGPGFLPRDTLIMLGLFFLAFAALDFYFPYALKKKWLEEQARKMSQPSPPSRHE